MQGSKLQTVAIEKEENIATVYLNRPEKRNAMNPLMFEELRTAFEEIRDDPETLVCIITGRGKAFSAGLDLTSLDMFTTVDATTFRVLVRRLQGTYRLLETMEKPVIAMVNGPALGAGMELALACDMITAATTATFGLLEVKYGLVTDLGATQRLPRIIGALKAKEMIMTGKVIDANEAEKMGMVNSVHSPEKLSEETKKLAETLKALPQPAVGLCKIAIDKSHGNSIDAGLEYEIQSQTICFNRLVEIMKSQRQA